VLACRIRELECWKESALSTHSSVSPPFYSAGVDVKPQLNWENGVAEGSRGVLLFRAHLPSCLSAASRPHRADQEAGPPPQPQNAGRPSSAGKEEGTGAACKQGRHTLVRQFDRLCGRDTTSHPVTPTPALHSSNPLTLPEGQHTSNALDTAYTSHHIQSQQPKRVIKRLERRHRHLHPLPWLLLLKLLLKLILVL